MHKPTIEKFISLLPYFLLAVLIIAVYRVSGELRFIINSIGWAWGVMSPFFYGFLLAYVINIPCSSIQKLILKTQGQLTPDSFLVKRRKSISLIIVMLILAIIVLLSLNWIIPAIVGSIILFIDSIPDHWEGVVQLIDNFNDLELLDLHISEEVIFNSLWGMIGNISIDRLAAPFSAIVGAANVMFRGLISFIASIYIMIEKERCKAYIDRLLRIFTSDNFRNTTKEIFSGLNRNLRQYIHTQTIGGIILSVMSMIALLIMGSHFFLLIGIMLWIANYIPYFGSIVATIIAILIVAFTQGITMGIIAAIALLLIQQVEVNIIQPKLMSSAFSMSPLLVIISISVGGAIGGILGMIVVIPIVAVMKDMFDNIVAYYERKKFGVVQEITVQRNE